jgi:hypothetical protein
LIDDGGTGYNECNVGSSDWCDVADSAAFGSAYRLNQGDAAGDAASWEFTGLEPDFYEVFVAYAPKLLLASDAPYGVYDGAQHLATILVDQKSPPCGPISQGKSWHKLGNFQIASGALRVELTDGAEGNVAADAVWIRPLRNELRVLSLDKSLPSENVTARVSVTVVTP